jgi:hypothetical protein
MTRTLLYLFPLLAAGALAAAPLPDALRSGTLRYIHRLMNDDGGYRISAAAAPSTLEPTRSCLRSLRVLEDQPGDRRGLGLFILSCYDPVTGGFSDLPGQTPEVRATAMGLMALVETRQARGERPQKAAEYLAMHAKTPAEIYVAVAALDAAGMKAKDPAAWLAPFESARNADGTYGKTAYETASAVVTILRLGGMVAGRERAAKQLNEAQDVSGGWAAADGHVNLAGTYRVLRALHMLKEKPDLARVREFIGKCRNTDHGYGAEPGQPSAANPTYYAVTMLGWIEEMEKG